MLVAVTEAGFYDLRARFSSTVCTRVCVCEKSHAWGLVDRLNRFQSNRRTSGDTLSHFEQLDNVTCEAINLFFFPHLNKNERSFFL